jgi:hypothetical protein
VVAAPLRRTESFDDTRVFAREVAQVLADVQRNGYGQTGVPPVCRASSPGWAGGDTDHLA